MAGAVVAGAVLAGGAAWAQGLSPGEGLTPGQTVLERPRPEVGALGTRAGGFVLYPSVGLEGRYNDNIFADRSDKTDDFIGIARPRLQIQSDWNVHSLETFARGDIGRHRSNSRENWEDFEVGTEGRLDVVRGTFVRALASFARLHEDRASPDDSGGIEPTRYNQLTTELGGEHRFGRFRAGVEGQLRRFEFTDNENAAGMAIPNDDRNRNVWTIGGRLGYEIIRNYEAFVAARYNWRRYHDRPDFSVEAFDRNSKGYELAAGVAVALTELVTGSFYVGYRRQSYQDGRLPTISGPSFGGDILWLPTRLTSVRWFASRTIEDTTTPNASGFFASRTGVAVDHELLRFLILGAEASYTHADFRGVTRREHTLHGSVYARYLMNRYAHLVLRYGHTRRFATTAGREFARNVVSLGVRLQY